MTAPALTCLYCDGPVMIEMRLDDSGLIVCAADNTCLASWTAEGQPIDGPNGDPVDGGPDAAPA